MRTVVARRGLLHASCAALVLAACASCTPRNLAGRTRLQGARPVDYRAAAASADAMLPRIRRHAETVASFGPRQTGQEGCERTLAYVRSELSSLRPGLAIREFGSAVTVALDRSGAADLERADEPFSHVVVRAGDGVGPWRAPAYALAPNSVQACATHAPEACPSRGGAPVAAPVACRNCEVPRRVVDLGAGKWEDFRGKDPSDALVLLDFNSGDAWMRAAGLGAAGALFVMPEETTVFQADQKYVATLPLNVPRALLRRDDGLRLRRALTGAAGAPVPEVRVELHGRLRFLNVPGRCIEMTIPGKDRTYAFVLTANLDARCIAPDLSFGAAETWGVGELIELTRLLSRETPSCDIQVIFTTGHWQGQQPMRDEMAPGAGRFERLGSYYRLAMGVDLEPEGTGVNLLTETAWNGDSASAYGWLGSVLFGANGWRDRILAGLGLDHGEVELFGGARPTMSETVEDGMGDRNNRSPLMYTPRYRTAEEPWQNALLTTFAFQSCRLARLSHFTPLDRFSTAPGPEAEGKLRPQMQITIALLRHLLDYPPALLPRMPPILHRPRDWGGYAQIRGGILEWDRRVGWFSERLPGTGAGNAQTGEPGLQTFVQAYPSYGGAMNDIGSRMRNFLPWPMAPERGQHRELQCFMFQDLRLLEGPAYEIRTVFAASPDVEYDVAGYSVDASGRLRYATDYGINGDGNKAFQCMDRTLDDWNQHVPVTLFECGSLELLGLVDTQRYNPNAEVYGGWLQSYGNTMTERGMSPYVTVTGVKDAATHTDFDRYGFTQYGAAAMVFLPADAGAGAEVILGETLKSFSVLGREPGGGDGPPGLRLRAGESRRLAGRERFTPRACVEALAALDGERMALFARHDVASPAAKRAAADSRAAMARGEAASRDGRWREAIGQYLRAWTFESQAYRRVLKLLIDVVSTTVLYFVMLIPFSFLVERLVFPQRSGLRTVMVSATVFAAFASILYAFHPGFRLANNVIVTTIAFVIVVMTIPALVLLLMRGVAMLKAIGSKSVITQQSEAESAGVVVAALSLAVSNMRRRRLRTGLTLTTITLLVAALVLLTTSSAFDFKILEPSGTSNASFEGLQILNARDHRLPLLKEMVEQYEGVLADVTPPDDPPLVLRREYINYGFDHKSANGTLYLTAGSRRAPLPYLQVMDWRDNLLEYAADDAGSTHLHLGDLMTGKFLEPGDRDACLLPNAIAAELGVGVGDAVTLMGMPLRVKGIWSDMEKQPGSETMIPGRLDRLVDLDGQPITAMDGSKSREGEPEYPIHAPSRSMAIVSRAWVEQHAVFPTCVYSLIVVPGGAAAAAAPDFRQRLSALSERLAGEILNVDVYTHAVDRATGRHYAERLSMYMATRIQGSGLMLVILAAAVLMILAVMTGTVYERMREIHIFSAVGLSPRHVAGIFLIEALVYAGIAAVLGYFLGVISLKLLLAHLKAIGSTQEFYPNYLGVFVLYATGVAVLATLASSIYPIRLARRLANPEGDQRWSFEETDSAGEGGGRCRVRLPFIATTIDEARAMMVYAHDWLAMHQGERSGRFVCQSPPAGRCPDGGIRLSAQVWLAPFERNLTQDAEIRAMPAADGRWWELNLYVRRTSGPEYLWRRGAGLFVNALCRHLLRWRAASREQEADCGARFGGLFPDSGGAS